MPTVKELKAHLRSQGVSFPSNAKKSDLEKIVKKLNPAAPKAPKIDYVKYPKKITLMDGRKIDNPDAGCGPDMFLVKGVCKRKYSAEVLDIICPKIALNKGILNPSKMQKIMDDTDLKGNAFTDEEIKLLQKHCDRRREEVMDEAQSMDARDIMIYQIIMDLFSKMPSLLGKKVFNDLFGAIGYRVNKISAGFVEIKKKASSSRAGQLIRQIPFSAISQNLISAAKYAGNKLVDGASFLATNGVRAAAWVINNPAARRFGMHLATLIKHSLCTAMGKLKDRKDMTWKSWAKEKWTVHKTDVFQMIQSAAPQISFGLATALGPAGIVAGPAMVALSTYVISSAAKGGQYKAFLDLFIKPCAEQFEYDIDRQALKEYFVGSGIGTFAPQLVAFFQNFGGDAIEYVLTAAGI